MLNCEVYSLYPFPQAYTWIKLSSLTMSVSEFGKSRSSVTSRPNRRKQSNLRGDGKKHTAPPSVEVTVEWGRGTMKQSRKGDVEKHWREEALGKKNVKECKKLNISQYGGCQCPWGKVGLVVTTGVEQEENQFTKNLGMNCWWKLRWWQYSVSSTMHRTLLGQSK